MSIQENGHSSYRDFLNLFRDKILILVPIVPIPILRR